MNASAIFKTDSANRYLTSLCQHFGRKLETKCDANKGWVQFPFGRFEMTADKTELKLCVSAGDQERLDQVMHIVTNHLERFAFRESPALDWKASPK